ncbi:MAG: VWA domain-containing protein [Terriglobales bacterium]
MQWPRCWFLCFALMFGSPFLHSQATAPASPSPVPRFESKVRVVLVDVVVTNGKDEPVTGLDRKDFQVLEDGKRQTISDFEEHKDVRLKPVKLPPMPPGVYTNFPPTKTTDSVNVLLLDALNTQVSDQSYVRAQLTRYLATVQPGTPLAVFVLTSGLRMIQTVTTDSSVLLAVFRDKQLGAGAQQSLLLLSPTESDSDQAQNNEMMQNMAGEIDFALAAMTHRGLGQVKLLQTDSRIEITLRAMQQLARYLEGIPGRKNVIWFSSSFPISLFPNQISPEAFDSMRQYEEELKKTANLMAAAQVAIYPIAAEGLVSDSLYEANGAKIGETRTSQMNQDLSDTRDRNSNYFSMEVLAENTGGKAFYNTNGLKDALAHAINSGSHYYTLTYTPANKKMDGKYRRIRVKFSDGSYKLTYRRGYYADRAKNAKVDKEQPVSDPLLPLMKRGLPDFAQIIYKIRVAPSNPQPAPGAAHAGDNEIKKSFTRLGVDFAVAMEDLKLETTPDGLHTGKIELMIVAYDRNGMVLNAIARRSEISLKRESYVAAQKVGLQLHCEIDVPNRALAEDDVYLRSGIYDLQSSNAGTLEIPLHAPTVSAVTTK